ncbi:MAG: HEAT repeat domain-containing protein [Anaerolineae bacterium]|jgi:HEAT repeat protein|nr:HEAT repeat domain-containing protein [Anaerolineae bacterium]
MDFEFDPQNFIAGLLAGWGSAFILYQARHILGAIRESVTERRETAQRYATRSAEGRYVGELIRFCEANHLAGATIELSKVLVEPRFIPLPRLATPPDDDPVRDPFRVVPRIHDHPDLHAPYNVDAATIEELSNGDRAVVLVGLPGSGRTTALQAIALWSLEAIDFKPPRDMIQERIESEEAALKSDVRADRIKQRMALEERARERLAEEQGEEYVAAMEGKKAFVPLFKRQMPVYVHLANVNPDPAEFGRNVDPAEPLVRAVQYQSGYVTSKTLPTKLYNRLNRGQALVLLDGFDNLSPAEQQRRLPWLQAFLKEYRKNVIIVAAPVNGYGTFTKMGFTPVFLRPWNDVAAHECAEHWANHWSRITGVRRRDNVRPPDMLIEIGKTKNRGLSPMEIALKLRAVYTGELREGGDPLTWFDLYLKAIGMTEALQPQAALAAALQLDEGYITTARLQEVLSGKRPTRAIAPARSINVDELFKADESDEDLDALFNADLPASELPDPDEKESKPDKKETAQATQLLKALERMGLITRYRGGRYLFRYAPLTAYLAAMTLDPATLRERAFDPTWDLTLTYGAGQLAIDDAAQALLDETPDLLHADLMRVAHWLIYSPAESKWRAPLLDRLGTLFNAPNQFPLLRERVAAALISTRDRNVLSVFQRGLRHTDAHVRRLACLALGALQDDSAIKAIANLLGDPDQEVQIAATLALGAIDTESALEEMTLALTSGNEQLQRAAAEAFAAIPKEGYPVLYDAIHSDDIGLRRAAVFGLRRVRTPWALIEIYRIFLEDQQWYVRSAAQQAFIDMQDNTNVSLRGYPAITQIEWLQEYVEEVGEQGQAPDTALVKVLNEATPTLQAVSAQAIGQLGLADKLDELYAALLHDDPMVRTAAHRGLADLQLQLGESLPAPAA